MAKRIFIILLIVCAWAIPFSAFAQGKPRLGILPFVGNKDGETIANLFSMQRTIMDAFTVVPRNSAADALVAERSFQQAGHTDSDSIAAIGKLLNADYIVSGFIRRLGNSNLIITTIVNVETFEQVAGDFREYRNIEEIEKLLPEISTLIINGSKKDTKNLPKLAIMPFRISDSAVNQSEAETLAQILAIEIGETGKYVVLPRTEAVTQAMRELEYQSTGETDEKGSKSIGGGINAEYVLSGSVSRLGNLNLFTAQILNMEDGSLHVGDYAQYSAISDGIMLMGDLNFKLTGIRSDISQKRLANIEQFRKSAPRERPVREPRARPVSNNSPYYNTLSASIGSAFADPLFIMTVHGTYSPMQFLFIEAGLDLGLGSQDEYVESYVSLFPFLNLGVFLPFINSGGLFTGAGIGYMYSYYLFTHPRANDPTYDPDIHGKIEGEANAFAVNFFVGINLWNYVSVSYSLRTNFTSASSKASIGLTLRF